MTTGEDSTEEFELTEAEPGLLEPNAGESESREEELTRVVQDYMPLVRHAVNRVLAGASRSSMLQYEDMVSCGVQGLLEAHRTYDPARREVLYVRSAPHTWCNPRRTQGRPSPASFPSKGVLRYR